MIERLAKMEHARFVEGDFPIWFVYTAGVAGEKFLRGLKDKKILSSMCPKCSTTYCPPRIYCESCLEDINDVQPVKGTGIVESFTHVHQGVDGKPLAEPVWCAAVRMDGTDGTLVHRLLNVEGDELRIGLKVAAVWAAKRTGSLVDIAGFEPAGRR